MKRLPIMLCPLILLSTLAFGEEDDNRQSSRGYVFVAPGVVVGQGDSAGLLHFGGGGEWSLYKGIGVGAELGYLAPYRYFSSGVGLFSLNGLYTFRTSASSRFEPFVTGGYSLLFREGHLNAVNFGAGTHYWFGKKVGLRLEVRDHVSPEYFSDHFIQGRVGVSFR
jgi:hypothetical protein